MKELEFKYQNPAVYVREFLAMTQQPEEGIREFLARLKDVRNRCDFNRPDHMIRQRLINGMSIEGIKEDMLRGHCHHRGGQGEHQV